MSLYKAEKIQNKNSQTVPDYQLESDGSYRIDGYDRINPFSSFLPGIGGFDGVPLWCLYVNRAQAVASFGVANKDNAIAEFLSATWAYQLTPVQGFRTFCKVNGSFYEPFQNNLTSEISEIKRSMWIEPDRLRLREVNKTAGLQFDVEYFSPVNQPLGSLVRKLKITNIGDQNQSISALDGLAVIVPAGFADFGLKNMRRLNEAYASVKLVGEKAAFYAARVMAHDQAEVVSVNCGNFYTSWVKQDSNLHSIEPFVDPDVIFGSGNDLVTPRNFVCSDSIDRDAQVWENRLPCALTPFDSDLPAGGSIELISMTGHSPNQQILVNHLSGITESGYFERLWHEVRALSDEILLPGFSVSSEPLLDAYNRQNYLDNIARGGVPVLLPSKDGDVPLHVFSRRHGDLERDYNYFELPPQPLSSGPGNYRDICQNRRYDNWFYPQLNEQAIKMFVELIQADGFNPLGIEGYKWKLPASIDAGEFCPVDCDYARAEFSNIFKEAFYPGEILKWLNDNSVVIDNRLEWLKNILGKCEKVLCASGFEGGYWVDHWIYITDMLDAYAAVYPDRIQSLFTGSRDISWYDEGVYVRPRNKKYYLKQGGFIQLDSIEHTPQAIVELPKVSVLAKLCVLMAIKALSFDSECRGIEMEAGRPGWNDSLNGLPALFGSSTCEAAELARMAKWVLDNLEDISDTEFPADTADLIQNALTELSGDEYSWHRSSQIREDYREKIRFNPSMDLKTIKGSVLKNLLEKIYRRAGEAVEKSIDPETGLIHTYFQHEPVDYELEGKPKDYKCLTSEEKVPCKKVLKFKQKTLPLFLEGQVHRLRLINSKEKARQVYRSLRNSPVFDKELEMYKLNECLNSCGDEIGRARTFSRGWFENESIWLHMSYKYLLELVRAGLYEDFYEDARTMLVPFMDPRVYGRSVLENSSFIASSACPDPNARGRGFVARLSGSTAEFIHIWQLLTVGEKPFKLENGQLRFGLTPALPAEWFTNDSRVVNFRGKSTQIPANCFACSLLGNILLVYHNQAGKNTFGEDSAKPVRYLLNENLDVRADEFEGQIAQDIRNRKYSRVDVWLE
ncbi:hypothetical protein [Limihaloglobus sulfuriphilus]|nr:hypothetical protein [Limihaloglobus sulfuriphilus]